MIFIMILRRKKILKFHAQGGRSTRPLYLHATAFHGQRRKGAVREGKVNQYRLLYVCGKIMQIYLPKIPQLTNICLYSKV